jgi:hypothetical protein
LLIIYVIRFLLLCVFWLLIPILLEVDVLVCLLMCYLDLLFGFYDSIEDGVFLCVLLWVLWKCTFEQIEFEATFVVKFFYRRIWIAIISIIDIAENRDCGDISNFNVTTQVMVYGKMFSVSAIMMDVKFIALMWWMFSCLLLDYCIRTGRDILIVKRFLLPTFLFNCHFFSNKRFLIIRHFQIWSLH